MASNKRLMKELGEITANPPPGCTITPPGEDMYTWEVIMEGPEDSIYAGGKYKIEIALPKEYPFKPPVLSFKTKIYHPNVTNDERGAMCLGMLKGEEWKPPNKIADVLKLVRAVLKAPQPDDAVETSIADTFRTNPKEFEKIARDWVGKYAK